MSSTFSGSASLPSSVLGGESLNWYSDQESPPPPLYSHRASDQGAPVRWPPQQQQQRRQQRRHQQRRLGHWRTQPAGHDYYRAVKSHLDLPSESDGYSTAAAAAAAAAAEALRRLALGGTNSETEADSGARRIVVRLPPILLHSPGGKELDTDTSYQQSIREWKAREQLGLPPMRGSDEWRLPHAAVPARPDFSRRVPQQPQAGGAVAAAVTHKERRARVSASALTAENISRLQDALAKRAADRLLGTTSATATTTSEYSAFESELFWLSTGLRRVYMPFVESAPLHDKTCSPADRRAADYEFPGWCYGCRLQQGEHWHGHPSYNPLRDRPVRVGGGFAYVTRELLHSLSGGNWSAAAAAAAMEHLASKDVAWQRTQLYNSVDDAVIRALAAHQQTTVPARYRKLPEIATPSVQREPAAVEPASSSVTPLSVISAGSVVVRRLSISSDNNSGSSTANDTSESIVGTTSDTDGSLAERHAKQRVSLRLGAAVEEKAEQRSGKKTSSRRRSLQDLAIVPLKKHISVIREQTELSVHHENVASPQELSTALGTEAPQVMPAAATSGATAAAAAASLPTQPPARESSTTRTPFVSERSVVVPRPVAERPAAHDAVGSSDKYTVRVKLLDGGGGGQQPGALLLGAATAAERQRSSEPVSKPTAAAELPPSPPPPPSQPVELDTVTLALVESGESESPLEEMPPPADDRAAVDSGHSPPAFSGSTDVTGASAAANDRGDDEAVDAGDVFSSGGGDESQPLARSTPSAKKSAKGATGSSDGLRKTLTHALQISNWKDPQVVPVETEKMANDADVAPSTLSDGSTSEPQREEPPKSGRGASSTERVEEVVVHRIGKRQKAPKKIAGGRRGNIPSILESAPRAPPPAEENLKEQRVSPELIPETSALPSNAKVDEGPSISESQQPVDVAAASVVERDSAVLTSEPADTDGAESITRIEDTDEATGLHQDAADQPAGSESEPRDQRKDGGETEAAGSGSVSREPSSIKYTPPGRRALLPPGPPKKPNFMHLLTLDVSTEEEEIVNSPPRSPTPDLDFEIERESPVEEEEDLSQNSTILSQPLPRIRYALSPSPVPPPAIVKEPTPEPREPTPEPIVIRRRPRKALDAFLHNNKGPRLPKRPEVIQPLTKKELQGIGDPLDYLSQFCLIRLDRLPYYEKVFREVVAYQQPRFQAAELPGTLSDPESAQAAQKASQPVAEQQSQARTVQAGNALATRDSTRVSSQTSDVTRPPLNVKLLRSFAKLMSVPEFNEPAINVGEFHVQRITFAMHRQYDKYDRLMQAAELLEAHRDRALADLAKRKHSDVLRPKPTGSETDKAPRPPAKTKASSQLPTIGSRRLAAASTAAAATALPKLSDGEVLHRLPSAVMDELLQDATVRSMTVRLTRLEERIAAAEQRLAQLQEERQEMELWAREVYEAERFPADDALARLLLPKDDGDILLQHLHPSEDDEMNLEELEYALRLVNNQLITHRELMYVYHILKIPGRRRINLKTFCCISALSEKVQELDPLVRDLINAFDYEALEVKMQVCKELFYMLADKSGDAIDGAISIRTLAAELIAGGISRENLGYIISKLDFRRKGYIEYLDFLVYIPLFFEIHRRIIANPLSDHRQSYGGFRRHLSQQEQALD